MQLMVANLFAQFSPGKIPVIPIPKKVNVQSGFFTLNSSSTISCNNPETLSDIEVFNAYIDKMYGYRLKIEKYTGVKKNQVVILSDVNMPSDNYSLSVDSDGVRIVGGNGAGVFYALQTLTLLLPAGKVTNLQIPFVEIEDNPRFSYRGMHLDVARHFFSVAEVKRYIDYLALYKFNAFHWHLTDDQGWRIEIKKYPKLHQIGGWRKGTLIGHKFDEPEQYDTIPYGGFYSQEEIKDVIQYASKRHIEVIPEIEMPGHALAALAAYPEFSCTGGPFETGKTWGVFQDVFCPKEETFQFIENILDEVCSLFPGKYIHIGGDECPKERWKECSHCRELIRKENLIDENGLQRFFTNRISDYLKKKNKIAIGWDEILDEKLSSDAVIMSWRGYKGGIEGASRGHDVIMTPYSHCYFDYYQSRFTDGKLAIGGYLPIDMIYRYEPVPDALNAQQSKHILGAQGNVWTEYISNEEYLQEMIFPRICALAEVLWSPLDRRDYNSFTSRLQSHFKFLKFNKINYSSAIYDISSRIHKGVEKNIEIELFTKFPRGQIHYTIDGTDPKLSSPVFSGNIVSDQSLSIRAALYEGVQQLGGIFIRNFSVSLSTAKEITLANPPHEEYNKGGAFSLIDGSTSSMPWLPEEWLGFAGNDLDATINLGELLRISKVTVDVLKENAGKIYLPKEVVVLISDNGKDFIKVASLNQSEIEKMKRALRLQFPSVQTKWVKVIAKNSNGKDWLFVDEIKVE
jgi:hexosaminidase